MSWDVSSLIERWDWENSNIGKWKFAPNFPNQYFNLTPLTAVYIFLVIELGLNGFLIANRLDQKEPVYTYSSWSFCLRMLSVVPSRSTWKKAVVWRSNSDWKIIYSICSSKLCNVELWTIPGKHGVFRGMKYSLLKLPAASWQAQLGEKSNRWETTGHQGCSTVGYSCTCTIFTLHAIKINFVSACCHSQRSTDIP